MGKIKSFWGNDDTSKMLNEMANQQEISKSKLINNAIKNSYDIFKRFKENKK